MHFLGILPVQRHFSFCLHSLYLILGTVETESLFERMKALGDYEKAHASFVARQPMGRLGQPDEIANLCIYLASDESLYVTGQEFVIDGGWKC